MDGVRKGAGGRAGGREGGRAGGGGREGGGGGGAGGRGASGGAGGGGGGTCLVEVLVLERHRGDRRLGDLHRLRRRRRRHHREGVRRDGGRRAELLDHRLDDLADGLRARERGDVLRLDVELLLHVREDLNTLDRVDAELRLERHVHLDHVRLVARLGGEHGEHDLGRLRRRHRRARRRRRGGDRRDARGDRRGAGAAELLDHRLDDLADGLRARERGDVLRLDVELLLHVREDLNTLDRVDAELRLERHVHLDHVRLVARLGGEHGEHDLRRLRRRHARRRGGGGGRRRRRGGGDGGGARTAELLDHRLDDLADGLRARERGDVLRLDVELLLHIREDLNTLDRVDAELRLERHVHLDHVRLVARLGGEHGEHDLGRLRRRHRRARRRRGGSGSDRRSTGTAELLDHRLDDLAHSLRARKGRDVLRLDVQLLLHIAQNLHTLDGVDAQLRRGGGRRRSGGVAAANGQGGDGGAVQGRRGVRGTRQVELSHLSLERHVHLNHIRLVASLGREHGKHNLRCLLRGRHGQQSGFVATCGEAERGGVVSQFCATGRSVGHHGGYAGRPRGWGWAEGRGARVMCVDLGTRAE